LYKNKHIWLIDATSYKKNISKDLISSKKVFYKLKAIARDKRIGDHNPPGLKTFSNGLLRVGTILNQNGYRISYFTIDEIIKNLNFGTLPDIIAFGAICTTVPICAKISLKVKEIKPEIIVAIGGAQSFFSPSLIREQFPEFDKVIPDSEFVAASKLVDSKIETFNSSDNVHLDYSILPYPLYDYSINLSTCHGCLHSCSYCLDNRYKFRDISIDGDISVLFGKIPSKTAIHYCDSNIGGNPFRALKVASAIKATNHDFLLSCDVRSDLVNPLLIRKIFSAGFVEIRLGLDSGNAKCLNRLGRKIEFDKFIKSLKCIRDNSNMYISVYMLTGLPGTSEMDTVKNKNIILQLFEQKLIDQIKHHLYVPYPTDHMRNGHPEVTIIQNDWSKYDRLSYPVYKLPGFTSDQIWQQYIEMEKFINETWSNALNVKGDELNRMYPDYNINSYLTDNANSSRSIYEDSNNLFQQIARVG